MIMHFDAIVDVLVTFKVLAQYSVLTSMTLYVPNHNRMLPDDQLRDSQCTRGYQKVRALMP